MKQHFPGLSNRHLEEALANDLVLFQGHRTHKGQKIAADRLGELDFSRLETFLHELKLGNPELKADIVGEYGDYLVLDKPPGMPSHPLSLFDKGTVTQWAFARFPDVASEFPEVQPTLTPHRLDTGTSGLVIVALRREAYENWRERFQKQRNSKKYLAWCWGKPAEDRFECHASLGHVAGDPRKMTALTEDISYSPPVQEAHSYITVLKRDRTHGLFLAEVVCHSGVTHQVRVHLKSRGYPLVGDELYDPDWSLRAWKPAFHLLRATELTAGEECFRVPSERFMQKVYGDLS